ncbi:MAG: nicotinate-nucleotide adenylyltransferase [Acidobacteriota bacterium]
MRIGILGGTFDPIHNGHLTLCEKICQNFSLDKIYFIPCNEPPHKTRKDISHPYHRYSMVVLATASHDRFFPSFYEIEKGNKSYTIDTLTYFQKAAGEENEVIFIIGLDSLIEIETWKDYEKILEGWNMIVINRSGYTISEAKRKLPNWIAEKIEIVPGKYSPAEAAFSTALTSSDTEPLKHQPLTSQLAPKKILFARVDPVNISSSIIREKVRKNEEIHGLVPDHVKMYIKKFNLYR